MFHRAHQKRARGFTMSNPLGSNITQPIRNHKSIEEIGIRNKDRIDCGLLMGTPSIKIRILNAIFLKKVLTLYIILLY